jgi:Dockerin type I domain
MYGKVYDALAGYSKGIADARLTLTMRLPSSLWTRSGADGSYKLLVPGPQLNAVLQVMLQVKASGYSPLSMVITTASLRAGPRRDLALTPLRKSYGDANRDGAVNVLDLVAVSSAYDRKEPSTGSGTDTNGDGTVDLFDLVAVSSGYQSQGSSSDLGADVNGDGQVDLFDLVAISSGHNAQGSTTNNGADVNGDGKVDLFDWVLVASHYGQTTP